MHRVVQPPKDALRVRLYVHAGRRAETLGLVQKQLPVSERGQSHFRCAKIGTVPNLLLDNSLGAAEE